MLKNATKQEYYDYYSISETPEHIISKLVEGSLWADQFEKDEAKMIQWIKDKHPEWKSDDPKKQAMYDHWIFSSAVSMRHSLDNDHDGSYAMMLRYGNRKRLLKTTK